MTGAHTPSVADISLRDWFAAQALPAVVADSDVLDTARQSGKWWTECVAVAAYDIADAMLAARATSKEASQSRNSTNEEGHHG